MSNQEIVAKVCQLFAAEKEKSDKVLANLLIEDAKCGGRENSAMWQMLKNLVPFDQQFKSFCENVVLSPDKMPSRPTTSAISSRPGTLMEEALNESPYHPELPNALPPSAECFNKWMFYLMEQTKSTAICIHPRFFVTFRHGTHRRFKIGDNLKIYQAQKEVDEQTGVDVCVAKIDESYDFILLKSESDVIDRGPRITQVEGSEPFTLAVFGNDLGSIAYLPGSIYSIRRHYFCGQGPFMLGTSRSSCGDSGGGIWGSRGLIGMNYGCTTMPLHNHQEAISQAAIFSPKNIISPAVEFEKAYMRELEKERKEQESLEQESPPVKKSCLMTVVDGITLFGSVAL